MSIGIYAMGGGYGHIARTCALAQSLLKANAKLRLHLYLPKRAKDWVSTFALQAKYGPSSPAGYARWIEHQVAADRPELLIVDCFPTGFYGELAGVLPLVPKRVFLTRWLDPTSVATEVDRAALLGFSTRVCTEEIPAEYQALGFVRVDPILAAGANEVIERDQARRFLGISGSAKLVILSTTRFDTTGHLAALQLRKLSRQHDFVLLCLGPGSKLWRKTLPLGRWMRAADLVVAPPGHNTYYEVVQSGVPAVFLPLKLANDNHHQRSAGQLGASHGALVSASPQQLPGLFPGVLRQELRARHPFHGGAQAAALILEALDSPPERAQLGRTPPCIRHSSGLTLVSQPNE